MNKLRTFLICCICLCATLAVSAQKFGYINSQELIQQMPKVKQANAELEALKKQYEKKIQEEGKVLQTKYQALLRKQEQGDISPKQYDVEAAALQKEQVELEKAQQEMGQNLAKKSEELLKPIRDEISNAIDMVAKENGFTYIFDYSIGIILYAEESADVSSLVKAKLNL